MQHTLNNILSLIAIALCINLAYACHRDCKEPAPDECSTEKACPRGYECDQGTCMCPEDALEVNGVCYQFSDTIPTWINRGTSCFCYDSIAISIYGTGNMRRLSMPLVDEGAYGSVTTSIFYYELPDGDSIHLFQMPIFCRRAGQNAIIPEGFGKILPNGDLRMRLIFKDDVTFEVVDECTTVMVKRQ